MCLLPLRKCQKLRVWLTTALLILGLCGCEVPNEISSTMITVDEPLDKSCILNSIKQTPGVLSAREVKWSEYDVTNFMFFYNTGTKENPTVLVRATPQGTEQYQNFFVSLNKIPTADLILNHKIMIDVNSTISKNCKIDLSDIKLECSSKNCGF